MATKSSRAFASWVKRMDITNREAARRLGMHTNTVNYYCLGRRCDKDKPIVVPTVVLLACSALEKNLTPVE